VGGIGVTTDEVLGQQPAIFERLEKHLAGRPFGSRCIFMLRAVQNGGAGA
jgi:hypothetical protein